LIWIQFFPPLGPRSALGQSTSWSQALMEHDAQSNASWAVLESQPSFAACDLDRRSDASWDLVSEDRFSCPSLDDLPCTPRASNSHVDVKCKLTVPLTIPEPQPAFQVTSKERIPSAEDEMRFTGDALVSLICSSRWADAVALWHDAPSCLHMAMQYTSYGESTLSWAVYKARSGGRACFELMSALLFACPSIAHKRGPHKFLPLHDAAWGNAHPAVALLLCAAHPAALYDVAQHETPHQVGHYHHFRSFAWPNPEKMLQDAMELRKCNLGNLSWLESLATLRLPLVDCGFMQNLQIKDVLGWLTQYQAQWSPEGAQVLGPIASLVQSFVSDRPLVSLEARRADTDGLRVSLSKKGSNAIVPGPEAHRIKQIFQQAPRRRRCVGRPSRTLASDDDEVILDNGDDGVQYVRELASKQEGRFAGLKRGRHSRCDFQENMEIVDTTGTKHHLSLHRARTLLEEIQRHTSAKWPSKAHLHRQRAWDRDLKAAQCSPEFD